MKLSPRAPRPVIRFVRRSFAATIVLAPLSLVALAGGCSNEMDPKECLKLREDAFVLLNAAQHCDTDADCRLSDWPGCSKPLSTAKVGAAPSTADKMKPMKDAFDKGKCKEDKSGCREAPPVYCKQGLCVLKEKGTPEGAGNTPADQIIIK